LLGDSQQVPHAVFEVPPLTKTVELTLSKETFTSLHVFTRDVGPRCWGVFTPENIEEGSQYILAAPKCHILSFKTLLLDNSASFTSSSVKDLCQSWKVKLSFEAPATV